MDLDVISLTSLAFIPANNFICAQLNEWSNWDPLNGAILSLDADTGRQLATMVMKYANGSFLRKINLLVSSLFPVNLSAITTQTFGLGTVRFCSRKSSDRCATRPRTE